MGIDPITTTIASAVAAPIVGSIFGGNSAPSAPSVNVYQPTGTGNADQQIQALLTSNFNALTGQNNPYSQLSPNFSSTFNTLYNTPGAPAYETGATNAGAAYGTVGNQSVANSGALNLAALALMPGAQQVYNMGLDPQQQLYNKMLQQTADRANVSNAQYGLTGQQAAGNLDQATTNFNIDWQNQQLQRALQALAGAGSAVGQAGSALTTGQNVGAAGAGSLLAGGAAPYQAQQTIGGNQETALAQYLAQLLGPVSSTQSTIGDLSGYMGQGINASAAGASQALNDYYAQLAGAQGGAAGGAAIGNALSGLFGTQATPVPNTALPWQSAGAGLAPFGAGGIADIASSW